LRYTASFCDRYWCCNQTNCDAQFFGWEFVISSPLCGVRPGFFAVVVEVEETKQEKVLWGLLGVDVGAVHY
jgi:hypothetical protein